MIEISYLMHLGDSIAWRWPYKSGGRFFRKREHTCFLLGVVPLIPFDVEVGILVDALLLVDPSSSVRTPPLAEASIGATLLIVDYLLLIIVMASCAEAEHPRLCCNRWSRASVHHYFCHSVFVSCCVSCTICKSYRFFLLLLSLFLAPLGCQHITLCAVANTLVLS